MKKLTYILISAMIAIGAVSCGDDDDTQKDNKKDPEVIPLTDEGTETDVSDVEKANPVTHSDLVFAYGCDPSWITEMEKDGVKLKNESGEESDCFKILTGIGMDAARFRIWVNPEVKSGVQFCALKDVITKAVRAQNAGMKIMIDFHYSDTWADPSNQKKPAAWDAAPSVDALADSAADFTKKCLEALKACNIDVNWVQVGNETRSGMMRTTSTGAKTDINGDMGANYVTIHNKCAKAARGVYPETKIVTHFQNGQDALYSSFTNIVKQLDLDILGFSLYPSWDNTVNSYSPDGISEAYYTQCANVMNSFATTYGKETMICEIGTTNIEQSTAGASLKSAFDYIKTNVSSCKGIFYWEPESFYGWGNYNAGGFTTTAQPAQALIDAYKH